MRFIPAAIAEQPAARHPVRLMELTEHSRSSGRSFSMRGDVRRARRQNRQVWTRPGGPAWPGTSFGDRGPAAEPGSAGRFGAAERHWPVKIQERWR